MLIARRGELRPRALEEAIVPKGWPLFPAPGVRFERYAVALLAAVVMTGLNALKSPCIDDPAYLAVARQAAAHPLDPYGFEQFWYNRPQPANEVLAPPVLPYWLALGMRLFGDGPTVMKLWLLPVAAMLTVALSSLLRRFARGVEAPLLLAIAFSPAVLPGINFMLDVPALALELAALALFLHAAERGSWRPIVVAGLLAGLASQTKYTGAMAWPLLLVAAALRRRPLAGVAAVALAVGVFVGWESFTSWRYGRSHFLIALDDSAMTLTEKLALPLFGLRLIGGVGAPLALLAAAALGRRVWLVAALALLLSASMAAIALVPDTHTSAWLWSEIDIGSGLPRRLFEVWGWLLIGLMLLVAGRLLVRGRWRAPRLNLRWTTVLLLIWLVLELSGYVAMTTFPAARRVMATLVVGHLLVAHLAARSCRGPGRPALWLAACGSAAAGLFFAAIDCADSRLEPEAVRAAAEYIHSEDGKARVWYTGHWGTQYAAEHLGFRPLAPGRSVLHEGDWLIDSPPHVARQSFQLDERMGPPVRVIVIDRWLRLRTLPPYYGGDQPIEWWPAPMHEVRVYRIRATWMPRP